VNHPGDFIFMPSEAQQPQKNVLLASEIQELRKRLTDLNSILSSAGGEQAALQRVKSKRVANATEVHNQLLAMAADLELQRNQRADQIEREKPVATFLSTYVVVGEYLFPVAMGAMAAGILYVSQDPTMLWELHIPGFRS
jgi:hypothetical protein